jgi:hypothetical protein
MIDHATNFPAAVVALGSQCASRASAGTEGSAVEGEAPEDGCDDDGPEGVGVEDSREADDVAAAIESLPPLTARGEQDNSVTGLASWRGATRNRYALAALKRVRHKLDGRDSCRLLASVHGSASEVGHTLDSASRLSVSEHVERVIAEATSLDNLALMYEGWAPWI